MGCSKQRPNTKKKLQIIIHGFQKAVWKSCRGCGGWKKEAEARGQVQNLIEYRRGRVSCESEGCCDA